MDGDRFQELGDLYSELGNSILDLVGPGEQHVLLYAEAGEGWADVGIFRKEPGGIHYLAPTGEVGGIVMDAWRAEVPEKRWAAMEYELRGKKFNVRFAYKEDFVAGETDDDRSDAAVRRVFGEGPIAYPPLAQLKV
jgi:hypothetical protein